MKVWHHGQIGAAADFSVSILDHGLLYGDGVFEGIRITAGRVFRLDCHLARLRRSAVSIGLELPYSTAALRSAVLETARANGAQDAYVRIIVTRGVGELGVDPASCHEPQVFCIVAELAMFDDDARHNGLRLMTSALRRPVADTLDPQVKSLNYLNNVLAKRDARAKRYDDALVLNLSGRVAEASAANIFAVHDGTVSTPPSSESALAGITRDSVLECCREIGLPTIEKALTRYDLIHADEAFLCGSGAGLVAIDSLDDQRIGTKQRAAFRRLVAAWPDYAAARGTPF